ncbi:VOC family protein [Rhodococcus opacus]|uniref:VOC family protein n=1 Tax=Rhodococcus opacus TaxID=37919 RepID=UPI0024751794|nr:VOC family protein [Rhodococcus opacus]MDH6288229.1 extradiol dioxygenase [Rhodococcus opacus]
MGIARLGYVGIRTRLREEWANFLLDGFGIPLERRDEGGTTLDVAELDEFTYRFALYPGEDEGLQHVGWVVDSPAEFGRLVDSVVDAGFKVTAGSEDELRSRGASAMSWFTDVAGFRVELALGMQRLPRREFDRGPGGFRGLGHLVLAVPDIKATREMYEGILGFRLTDYREPGLYFLRCNSVHHSIAIAQSETPALHHLEFEAPSLDDVGYRYDTVRDAGITVSAELGRHANDRAFSFYVRTPGGFQVEYGWGGIEVGDDWVPHDFSEGDLWGHRRLLSDPFAPRRSQ